jgi:hypothetical protein
VYLYKKTKEHHCLRACTPRLVFFSVPVQEN